MINNGILVSSLTSLLHGATISLCIASLALAIGVFGGMVLACMQLYGNAVIRLIAHAYVTIIRGTPMLVQIATLFFVMPLFGVMIPAFWSAVIAIGLNSAAYMSQIIRAGIQAVGQGQIEAAQTLGFTWYQAMKFIVLPQAVRTVFPALGNECVTLIKDSSLASVIGVAELNYQASLIMSRTYDALTAYAGVTILYLCMTSGTALLMHVLEKRMRYVKN